MLIRTSLAASLLLCLTACGSNPPLPDPVIQRVEVTRYIPVPATLTAPCLVDPTQRTIGEGLENGVKLRACVDELNERMTSIRDLATPPI